MNKEDESKVAKLNIDSKEDSYEVSRIASEAISYVISRRAVESIEYILMFCREKFIIPQVLDTFIVELLKDNKKKSSITILSILTQYEVIIKYSESRAKDVEKMISEVRQK